jgi:hypothetical protein
MSHFLDAAVPELPRMPMLAARIVGEVLASPPPLARAKFKGLLPLASKNQESKN